MHVDEKCYIYGATDITYCRKMEAFVCCMWMKNAARGPSP